mmetsp:Transcript_24371/g.22146  ORF Transcript_24371/g.22146 Transcript_24371/m.22146 type:complete len:203 (+) Transcript_24371:64-672(+)
MGCTVSKADNKEVVVEEIVEEEVDYKPIHSAIRWNKSFDEVKALLSSNKAVNAVDPNNGNTPLHIAVQNGHYDIVTFLIDKKAQVNAQNKRGNTPLHMAMAYDYYDCVKALLNAGADTKILNDVNHPAERGLEGDKLIGIVALLSAKSAEDAIDALNMCELKKSELEKASFVQAGLKGKKSLGKLWTNDIQEKFKSVMNDLK